MLADNQPNLSEYRHDYQTVDEERDEAPMNTPRLLSNRYELGDTLGYGGMSEVHRGRDVRLGRDVAVKVLRADLARDPQFQERFRREAQNAAALNHPAIVAVYDTGETHTEHGPLPYIVMEFVDGRTLRDLVKTEGPLPGKRAMEIMADVCAALDFSHRHGIVHRDVKPANAMITRNGAVKVMDFGIARAVADGQAAVTQTAAVIGTAQYLSPEQARGEAVDARSDVYAAGCVLFELLTGEPPFTGDSPVAVAYQHVREDPKPPSALNPRVSPALDAIVLKAMAKNPANRYQSAAEMRGDLVRVLSGQRPAAPMVMTDEDRTSLMGAGRPTEVVSGRHRPDARTVNYGYGSDEDEQRRRRRKWIIGIAAGVVVIALATWLIPDLLGGNQVGKSQVPTSLIGEQFQQAEQQIQQASLRPALKYVYCQPGPNGAPAPCSSDEIGKVLSTDPPGGAYLQPGDTVTLNVGQSPQTVQMPDLTGMTQAEAAAKLQSLNLVLSSNINKQPATDVKQVNKVITQTPPPGQPVQQFTNVSITIGLPPQMVPLPDVTNQPLDQATSTLTAAGFKVKAVSMSSGQPSGTVVQESPAGGQQQPYGSTVTLGVSNGTGSSFSMPSIVGLTQSQAQQVLRQQGWNGQFNVSQTTTNDPSQNGQIAAQNPAAGQDESTDGTVSIKVYRYGFSAFN